MVEGPKLVVKTMAKIDGRPLVGMTESAHAASIGAMQNSLDSIES